MSSFRRIGGGEQPKGTRISVHNSNILTSTGCSSFDDLLGGGIPMGNILLLEKDRWTKYAETLLKYYIAQGIEHNHRVLVLGAPLDLMATVKEKAAPELPEETDSRVRQLGQTRMNIAWRYQQMQLKEKGTTKVINNQVYCNTFDLTKTKKIELEFVTSLKEIETILKTEQKVCRIAITNFDENWDFLNSLKYLIEEKLCTVMIGCPAYLYKHYRSTSHPLIRSFEYLADCVVEIESFQGSTNPINEKYTSDYQGLVHLKKVFQRGEIKCGGRKEMGFKVRRKRFEIEKFTLPPEDAEPVKDEKSLDF